MKKEKFDDLEIEIISALVNDEIEKIEETQERRTTLKQYEFDLRNLKHKVDLMMINRANKRG